MNKISFQGKFVIQQIRDGIVIKEFKQLNTVMNIALNEILDIMFDSGTQITTWYMGLIDSAGFTAIAKTDTSASHGGWAENTDYDEATRPIWNPDPPSSQIIQNPITALTVFTMNATKTITGAFVISENTKGGAVGILWSATLFEGDDLDVIATDIINIQYILSTEAI